MLQPVSVNATTGSDVNFTAITANCSSIFLFISGVRNNVYQYDINSTYLKAVYSFTNISLADDSSTIQFKAYSSTVGDPALSDIATLRVQGLIPICYNISISSYRSS